MLKSDKIIIAFIFVCSVFSINSNAQQWTAEQKEVWKAVETYVDLGVKGDVEGFLSYFDESYRGWTYESDAPENKEAVKKMVSYWFPISKVNYYILTPAVIWVNGNFAYAHYYYSQLTENKEGKTEWEKGRWTDILMKKDGKWILVGDHGGKTSK